MHVNTCCIFVGKGNNSLNSCLFWHYKSIETMLTALCSVEMFCVSCLGSSPASTNSSQGANQPPPPGLHNGSQMQLNHRSIFQADNNSFFSSNTFQKISTTTSMPSNSLTGMYNTSSSTSLSHSIIIFISSIVQKCLRLIRIRILSCSSLAMLQLLQELCVDE